MESDSSSSEEGAPPSPQVDLPPPEGPFPVLKLPLVALHEVLNLHDPGELLHLSRVSKKSRLSVKAYTSRFTYRQSINLRDWKDHIIETIDHQKSYRYPKVHTWSGAPHRWGRYIPDEAGPITEAIEEWSDVFHKPKTSIYLEYAFHIRPILEVVKRLELYMEEVEIWNDFYARDNPELFRFAMEQCKEAEKLTWSMHAPYNFRIEPPIRFQCERFEAGESNFGVTADNLMEFFGDCKEVDISIPIPFENLNTFLIQWIAGCRIQFFRIWLFSTKLPEVPPMGPIFQGIEDYRVVQKVKLSKKQNGLFKFKTAYIIKNVDGREATIAWDKEMFILECGEVEEYGEEEDEPEDEQQDEQENDEEDN